MLNIYYGRESIDKERFMYETIAETGEDTLVIVPDQYTLEAEKQAFRIMEKTSLLNVEIISMSRLGYRLLEQFGGSRENFIDKYGRHMLLSLIVKEEAENISVFQGNLSGTPFLELLNNFISEMKQYDTKPKDLISLSESFPKETLLASKLKDIGLIYEKYEKKIAGKYTDSEDYINLYMDKIQRSDQIKNSSVWIYGFDSFAPKSLQVIDRLMNHAKDVNVVLTWDTQCRDEDLFQLTGIVKDNLAKSAKTQGISYSETEIPLKYAYTTKPKAIMTLEKELYSITKNKSPNCDGITVVEAANMYNEAESAASYILYLLRERDLRHRDILIICNDQKIRGSILKRVFSEYGMNFFTDTKRGILNSPVIIFLIALIQLAALGYNTVNIFRMLKTGLTSIAPDDIEALENYTIVYRIKGNMWKHPFSKGEESMGSDKLGIIEETRQKIVEMIEPLRREIDKVTTYRGAVELIYSYITEKIKLNEVLESFAQEQMNEGLVDDSMETVQIWERFIGILDQIVQLLGEEAFDKEQLLHVLVAGLEQVEVGVLPPTVDDILMGTMQRTRAGKVKAVLVVGANEGLLPAENSDGGLFTLKELEFIAQQGDDICKSDKIRMMEEQIAIYRNLSKPEENLWISYCGADADGKEIRESQIIGQLHKIFPKLLEFQDVVNRDDPSELIGGEINTLRHLTENLRKMEKGESVNWKWKAVYNWYEENRKELLDNIKDGIKFSNIKEPIPIEIVGDLYKREPDKPLSISPSRLEKFSRCPFAHFIAYGLRPEERQIFQASGREIGDIYHRCLMEFSIKMTEENLWDDVSFSQCKTIVSDIIDNQAAAYKEGLFNYGNEEKYKALRIKDACAFVAWALVSHVRTGEIKSSSYEIAFGRGKSIDAIEIETATEKVFIEGKIDRVDVLANSTVKIIDYKTGNEKFDVKEAEAGYRLQLMLYLEAAQERKRQPAGVFYFLISNPIVNIKANDPTKFEIISKEIMKSFRLNGIMVDEPSVIGGIAGQFDKLSDVVPLRQSADGIIKGTGGNILLSEEDFADLQEKVHNKVGELCRELVSGNIAAHPKKSGDKKPCDFCQYKEICRFDLRFDGCSYETVK